MKKIINIQWISYKTHVSVHKKLETSKLKILVNVIWVFYKEIMNSKLNSNHNSTTKKMKYIECPEYIIN